MFQITVPCHLFCVEETTARQVCSDRFLPIAVTMLKKKPQLDKCTVTDSFQSHSDHVEETTARQVYSDRFLSLTQWPC